MTEEESQILFTKAERYVECQKFDKAEAIYQELLVSIPKKNLIYTNLGTLYLFRKNYVKAIELFQEALAFNPNDQLAKHQLAQTHVNFAHALLSKGDYTNGFQELIHWHDKFPEIFSGFTAPLWKGEDLTDQTILLFMDHRAGDIVFYSRYISLLKQKKAKIVIEILPELKRLFAAMNEIDHLLELGGRTQYQYDYFSPFADLPYYFKTTLDTLPKTIPYFNIKKSQTLTSPCKKIGIFWRGREEDRSQSTRSCSLLLFSKLIQENPEIQFYSLQKQDPKNELAHFPQIINLAPQLHDFYATAQYMQEMDFIITIDTSIANLAGALGLNTWVLLKHKPDWRWIYPDDHTRSPWYPSVRCFCQPQIKKWEPLFESLSQELKKIKI